MSKLAEEARKLNLPIFIQTSLLDMRHHLGYCFVPETPILEVAQVINRYRENVFIVGGGKHFSNTVQQLLKYASKNQNFYISTDGLGGPFDCIERLVAQIGSSRLLFGTRIPILYAEASKLMIEKSGISEDDKKKILGGEYRENSFSNRIAIFSVSSPQRFVSIIYLFASRGYLQNFSINPQNLSSRSHMIS